MNYFTDTRLCKDVLSIIKMYYGTFENEIKLLQDLLVPQNIDHPLSQLDDYYNTHTTVYSPMLQIKWESNQALESEFKSKLLNTCLDKMNRFAVVSQMINQDQSKILYNLYTQDDKRYYKHNEQDYKQISNNLCILKMLFQFLIWRSPELCFREHSLKYSESDGPIFQVWNEYVEYNLYVYKRYNSGKCKLITSITMAVIHNIYSDKHKFRRDGIHLYDFLN